MSVRIALLRGINVGGRNILPMRELVRDLESLGLDAVETYIQSGNVVFHDVDRGDHELGDAIADAIESRHGFRPRVLVLGAEAFFEAMAANPFPEAEAEPKTLHLFFATEVPGDPDLDRFEALRAPSERFRLVDRVFYLHAPDGIGRSKLAAKVETGLGLAVTARNWRTVTKLAAMAET